MGLGWARQGRPKGLGFGGSPDSKGGEGRISAGEFPSSDGAQNSTKTCHSIYQIEAPKAKKIASQYQKEADKCSSGMETCEEAREKGEATLEAQQKQTARAASSFPLRSLYYHIVRTVSLCSSSRNKVTDPQAIKIIWFILKLLNV
ncbi:hypothetical protein DVH24_003937 [Malus domestica]|uniref:Uncharacterized protein n=1 Tax=Malus domestica TaxID=3750 RepID=A0A498KBU9_MALDO|nr:hypothetical protein DVH24_003937 [Malus domestica]